jgi:riboflavin kinase/FMN adenylyltransferase
VIGYDHGFGKDREGSVEMLRYLGGDMGFKVDVVEAFNVEGEPVSSSRIRRLLNAGDAATAARLLGRPYRLEGVVVRGERIPGLLHLGPRPTFPGFAPTIELHLLDWSGDIYGDHVRVDVIDHIRDIAPFSSVEALIEAIKGDERDGRRILGLG